jgi:hypothetical protein
VTQMPGLPRSPGRETGLIAGLLLLAGVITSLVSTVVLGGTLADANYLESIKANETRVLVSVVLQFLTAVESAGIAVAFYPVLRARSPALAIGAVSFRVIEAVFYSLAALFLVCLVALSYQPTNLDTATRTVLGDLLKTARDAANYLFGVFSFGIGATLYYVVFYRARLLPRWLSLWGLFGAALILVAAMATLFDGPPYAIEGATAVFALPIAAQEIVLGLWLIAKGFSAGGSASTPAVQVH